MNIRTRNEKRKEPNEFLRRRKIYTNRNRIPRTRRRTCSRFFFSVHGEVNAFKWNLILVSPILCHGCCFFYFEWKNKIVKLALLVIAKKRKHKNSKTAKEESERELVAVCCQNLAWHTVRYKSTEPPNLRSILTQVWEKNEHASTAASASKYRTRHVLICLLLQLCCRGLSFVLHVLFRMKKKVECVDWIETLKNNAI